MDTGKNYNNYLNKYMSKISDILFINIPHFPEGNGYLIFMESKKLIPFEIERVFVVSANANTIRGQHAHFKCTQFLTCTNGLVIVHCDDGLNKKTFTLDHPSIGLLIPPGIWAQQDYMLDNSILTVLCDRQYEAEDYFRDYKLFLDHKNS